MNKKYEVVRMHICGFERKNGVLTSDLSKYPARLCVFDRESKRVIDVETMHEYPYVKVINMKYFSSNENNLKMEAGKRYGCVEYATMLSIEVSSSELDRCKRIISLLNQNFKFKDGNSELSNEQYLDLIKNEEKTNKSSKKLKKRK